MIALLRIFLLSDGAKVETVLRILGNLSFPGVAALGWILSQNAGQQKLTTGHISQANLRQNN